MSAKCVRVQNAWKAHVNATQPMESASTQQACSHSSMEAADTALLVPCKITRKCDQVTGKRREGDE